MFTSLCASLLYDNLIVLFFTSLHSSVITSKTKNIKKDRATTMTEEKEVKARLAKEARLAAVAKAKEEEEEEQKK